MKHLIKIESMPHGVLGVRHAGLDQQYCEAGEQVILNWQPDAQWGLQEAHYTDGDGNVTPIDLTPVKVNGKDVVVFTMPAANITIGGTFKMFVSQDWTEGTNPSKGEVLTVGNNGEPTPIPVDELANEIAEGENDLVDAIDRLNPFKGWYTDLASLQTNHPSPQVGDYAYVKGAESTDPAAIYECTTNGSWSDSGRTADTSNVQTFASGEEVNEVHIVDDLTTGGTEDVLSAEKGKELAKISISVPIDITASPARNLIVDNSGVWGNMSGNGLCALVPIKSGVTYRITANELKDTIISILAEEDFGYVGQNAVFASGFSARITLSVTQDFIFTAPTDAKSILILKQNAVGDNNAPYLYANFISTNGTLAQYIYATNLSFGQKSVTIGAIVLKRLDNSTYTTYHVNDTFSFVQNQTGVLVLSSEGTVSVKSSLQNISDTDIVLLLHSGSENRFVDGAFYADYINSIVNTTDELEFFIAGNMGVNSNSVSLASANYKRKSMNAQSNLIIDSTYTFDSTNGYVLVFTSNNTLLQRSGVSAILSSDVVLLTYNPNYGYTGGLLLPRVLDLLHYGSGSALTANQYRDICIAYLNKVGERVGINKSTFLAPDGASLVTAKEMVLMIVAGISNNIISSIWNKAVDYGTVYGPNKRIDVYENSFIDEESHPFVADLGNYYHIWGGKTGSELLPGSGYIGRNLCVAVKSNTDDSWLVGAVFDAVNDVQGDNRFSIAKQLFDALESHRTGTSVDISSLNCGSAFAIVLPNNGNIVTYQNYDGYISIGKNENTITNSRSTTKIMTALAIVENIRLFDRVVVKAADIAGYSGSSGNMYQDGDELSVLDMVKSMILTSSSHACWFAARLLGQKYMETNDEPMFVMRLAGQTAYFVGIGVKWIDWLNTPDYEVWSTKKGITLSCTDESSPIVKSSGGNVNYGSVEVKGGDYILSNSLYS